MIDDFLLRALIAGGIIALASAPLGCLIVWRRMAYFGDATGHAALLGVALAMSFSMPLMLGVIVITAAMALTVTFATRKGTYAADTILGVFSHSALAIGLVAAAVLPGVRLNLLDTLLGNILTVSNSEILVMAAGAIGIILVIAIFWRPLLNATLSPELLVAEGGSILRDRLVFTLTLAFFVAISMKLVGILLITAMLILPAAAAAPVSRSPERMVFFTAIIGMASVTGGIWLSWQADIQAGPAIIVTASLLFVLLNLFRRN
ncbi:MAG: metal ABC transporter permease [Rhodobacteraceae bacterium]|nr:metal ABC transporter permease [Paracoccaceae bacterium]